MAKRAPRSKPSRVQLDDALGAFACSIVEDFLLDPDGHAAYEKTRTKAALRKAAKLPIPEPLETDTLSNGGMLVLIPMLAANHFAVMVNHSSFAASVAIAYDLDDEGPAPTAVIAFEGDVAKAFKQVKAWIDELDVESDSDDVDEMLSQIAMAQPPAREPLPKDAPARVQAMIVRAAAALRKSDYTGAPDTDLAWLEAHPDSLFLLLDRYVAACSNKRRDDAAIATIQNLLVVQLECIRYQVERDWDWAADLAKEFEIRILALADAKTLDVQDWSFLPSALGRARLPVSPESAEAFAMAGAALSPPIDPASMHATLRDVLGKLVDEVRDPFEIGDAVRDIVGTGLAEIRAFIAHELALSPNQRARDAVPMLLLDPSAEVRQATVAALEQTAMPDTLSPETLRRLIAMRNWLPEAERPALDRAIRKAREKGVAIAAWPAGVDVAVIASTIDGVGAQSLTMTSRVGRKGLFAMVLLKNGVTDTSVMPDLPRREIQQNVRMLLETAPTSEVDRAFVDTIVQHAVATSLAAGKVPVIGLLDIAERIGATDWKDRALDPPACTAELFADLPPEDRTDAAIAVSLRRTGALTGADDIFGTWYEDNKEAHDIVVSVPRRDGAKAEQLVLDKVLEKQRGPWADRLLLLTLWARAASDKQHHARWKDFLVLAHCLLNGRKLADIPLMRAAARATVRAARR